MDLQTSTGPSDVDEKRERSQEGGERGGVSGRY